MLLTRCGSESRLCKETVSEWDLLVNTSTVVYIYGILWVQSTEKWSDVSTSFHLTCPALSVWVDPTYWLWHRARASPDPDHRTDRFHFGTLYHCRANGPCHIVNAVRCAARTYNMEILRFANGFPHGCFNQNLSRNVLMETRTLFPVSIHILQYTVIKPWTMLKKEIFIQCAASLLQL